ncbi:NADPH:quinone oxidoreductase family protein [Sphingobium sp.]|uniref:NADPH:quinone oxidoreductase family protein n=1 Tax=Sphingobium sp. TaxID=1912891 RepID=UPI002BC7E318|nr:NADPH:quinone oxidoreductase family protein [Sphingobium sp.]HUD92699.1 NADPH:quinone oxidoreductase family protein [Sphingobium sp.]
MRMVSSDRLGPPDDYAIVERPLPEPEEGQLLIRVEAVSLGYADVLAAAGGYQVTPPLPFVPGTEASGIVVASGPNVRGPVVRDKVVVSRFGGCLADHVLAAEREVSPMPASMSFEQAASYRSNYATALHALKDRAKIQEGETLLVLGAAGGVGTAAVQIGRRLGARVIAGASSEAKRRFALDQGAHQILDYGVEKWRAQLKELTDGKGVGVVFDPVGGGLFEQAFRSLAWGGRHVVIGFVAGPIPRLPANLPLLKGAALLGADIRQFYLKEAEAAAANDRQIRSWCDEGLQPPVGRLFDFSDFRAAMTAASSGTSLGKVVIRVGPH